MIKLQMLLLLVIIILGGSSFTLGQTWFKRGDHLCSARKLSEKPLFNAIKVGNYSLLEKLLQKGVSPNISDDCGIPIIFYTIGILRLEMMKILVKAGAKVNVLDGFYNQPPLFHLIDLFDASNDDNSDEIYDSIKFLIENGANVNLKIKSSDSALIEAVNKRKTRLVELLIASGVEINYQDGGGMTAYSYAAQLGDRDLRTILIKAGADVKIGVQEYQNQWRENAFFKAAADGRTDVVEAMLASGTDVNSANEGGKMTALMRATEESTVDSLLAAGADVNLKDNSGHTALMWAVLFRLNSIVEKLIAAGADVNTRNDKGESALDLASNNTTREILIKAGAK